MRKNLDCVSLRGMRNVSRNLTNQRKEKGTILYISPLRSVDTDKDDETDNSNHGSDDNKGEPVTKPVGGDRERERNNPRNDPNRHGAQLSLNGGGSPGVNDGGCEVGESVGGNEETEVHERTGEELVVGEQNLEIAEANRAGVTARVTDIVAKTAVDPIFFFRAQPLDILGKVRDQEVREDSNQNSGTSL